MLFISFQRILAEYLVPVVAKTHGHVFNGVSGIQPDFQSFTVVHHFEFQLGFDVIQRAHDPSKIKHGHVLNGFVLSRGRGRFRCGRTLFSDSEFEVLVDGFGQCPAEFHEPFGKGHFPAGEFSGIVFGAQVADGPVPYRDTFEE